MNPIPSNLIFYQIRFGSSIKISSDWISYDPIRLNSFALLQRGLPTGDQKFLNELHSPFPFPFPMAAFLVSGFCLRTQRLARLCMSKVNARWSLYNKHCIVRTPRAFALHSPREGKWGEEWSNVLSFSPQSDSQQAAQERDKQ